MTTEQLRKKKAPFGTDFEFKGKMYRYMKAGMVANSRTDIWFRPVPHYGDAKRVGWEQVAGYHGRRISQKEHLDFARRVSAWRDRSRKKKLVIDFETTPERIDQVLKDHSANKLLENFFYNGKEYRVLRAGEFAASGVDIMHWNRDGRFPELKTLDWFLVFVDAQVTPDDERRGAYATLVNPEKPAEGLFSSGPARKAITGSPEGGVPLPEILKAEFARGWKEAMNYVAAKMEARAETIAETRDKLYKDAETLRNIKPIDPSQI